LTFANQNPLHTTNTQLLHKHPHTISNTQNRLHQALLLSSQTF